MEFNRVPRWGLLCRIGVLALLLPTGLAQGADELPALHAQAHRTSVSGLSSGAFMAVQYGTAYAESVMGIGVIAGGPYNCAYVNLMGVETCMSGQPLGLSSWVAAQGFAALGQIDRVSAISKQKVYLYSGTQDKVVKPSVVQATRDFYRAAGVPKANLTFVANLPSGHAFISPTFGDPCASTQSPYVDRCSQKSVAYDQPRAVLRHIYGPLQAAASSLSSTVRPFNQRAFSGAASGLDGVGFFYAPTSCMASSDRCAVHVVFHGCKQGASVVGSDVYSKVGYNRWADNNHLIVLYPQVTPSKLFPLNPEGCWDWWGYSGFDFQLRAGPQMGAVKAMVDRLTGNP